MFQKYCLLELRKKCDAPSKQAYDFSKLILRSYHYIVSTFASDAKKYSAFVDKSFHLPKKSIVSDIVNHFVVRKNVAHLNHSSRGPNKRISDGTKPAQVPYYDGCGSTLHPNFVSLSVFFKLACFDIFTLQRKRNDERQNMDRKSLLPHPP